ncbi:MAG: hypothetical protein EPO40_32405 [Myxococcaceae bacterium]|nr:MAG: hypothetical protein EPO40_32405 [Myxococcaceae bacterium]
MKTTLRVLGLSISFVVALFVFLFVAYGMRARLPPLPLRAIGRAEALSAFEGERQLATQLGMTLAEEGEAPVTLVDGVGVWRRPIALGARECVAVIVTAYGYQSPRAVAVQDLAADSSRITTYPVAPLSVHRGSEGLVAQTQWCNWDAQPRVAVAETRGTDPLVNSPFHEGVLHYAVYRAPWGRVGGPLALTRGELSASGLASLGPEPAVLAAQSQVPPGARSLGAAIELTMAGARLLPANATTYQRLYDAVRGDLDAGVNPRVDPFVPPGDRWGLGLPVNFRQVTETALRGARQPPLHDAVIEVAENRFRRVLLVADLGRLGASCATLMFTRLVVAQGASLMRHQGAERGVAIPAQGNVVIDRQCPAGAVVIYTASDSDQETYRLDVYATTN